ncbi:MAG TPA: DUF4124 domain-containing protein [Gammaproteobacteria bacterium]|nr:DUF4124 domain-containing protein [Gammaproteobacteria bacterium]
MKIIIAAVALSLAGAAWSDTPIYKWVDAQGVAHYSTVPHDNNAKPIGIVNTGSLPNPSTAPAPASATKTAAADATLVMPTPADSPACKAGRDRLFKYLHADSLYQIDSNGQKQKLSVQDMQKALDEARDYVRQACSPGGGGQ